MRTLRRLVAVMALGLFAPMVQASLIFSFSFDTPVANTPPTPITGEIRFKNDSGQQAASSVIITSIGSHTKGHPFPLDVLRDDVPGDGWTLGNNLFTVTGGVITSWNFFAFHDHMPDLTSILFEFLEIGTGILTSPPTPPVQAPFLRIRFSNQQADELTESITGPTFILLNGNSVPAPSVLLLLGIGVAGLQAVRRRQRIAAAC